MDQDKLGWDKERAKGSGSVFTGSNTKAHQDPGEALFVGATVELLIKGKNWDFLRSTIFSILSSGLPVL